MAHTIRELAEILGSSVPGGADTAITGVAGLRDAMPGDASFLADARYASLMKTTRASAVIVPDAFRGESGAVLLRVADPSAAFQRVVRLFCHPPAPHPEGIHPTAVIAPDAVLADGVGVGPHAVIESGARVGARSRLWAGCHLGADSTLGEDCILYPHVSVREHCRIGNRVILHNGVVIGGDGFGYTVDAEGIRTKIPQLGAVDIGDDTEIGCNSTVDRARFGLTRIGRGVKIDNLVHVAHNVVIGDHAVLIAQVGIAGSTVIGEKVILGGKSAAVGHVTIGDGALVAARSVVTKDIPPGMHVAGFPAIPYIQDARQHAELIRLPQLRKRIQHLELRLQELEARLPPPAEPLSF
jgi:UDP-3-O-[3-hydroxymyristoyl] glucosamine N-acyltransferase